MKENGKKDTFAYMIVERRHFYNLSVQSHQHLNETVNDKKHNERDVCPKK